MPCTGCYKGELHRHQVLCDSYWWQRVRNEPHTHTLPTDSVPGWWGGDMERTPGPVIWGTWMLEGCQVGMSVGMWEKGSGCSGPNISLCTNPSPCGNSSPKGNLLSLLQILSRPCFPVPLLVQVWCSVLGFGKLILIMRLGLTNTHYRIKNK